MKNSIVLLYSMQLIHYTVALVGWDTQITHMQILFSKSFFVFVYSSLTLLKGLH